MAIKTDPDDLNQGSSLAVASAIFATVRGRIYASIPQPRTCFLLWRSGNISRFGITARRSTTGCIRLSQSIPQPMITNATK